MKFTFTIFIALILIQCRSKSERDSVNTSHLEAQKSYRQNQEKWNLEMLTRDINSFSGRDIGPFTTSAFPNPYYKLFGDSSFAGIDSFTYNGVNGYLKQITNKKILFNSFFQNKNSINTGRLGEKNSEIFFQIIMLTDSIDEVNYSHSRSTIISRNHPNYHGQGYYMTKNLRVDYVAFTTVDRNAYAIINTRLFDLGLGKTILIAPQKDGSLRSMQIESPQMSKDEIDDYTDELLTKNLIIDFFTAPGNI